jgi:hypothetical protein
VKGGSLLPGRCTHGTAREKSVGLRYIVSCSSRFAVHILHSLDAQRDLCTSNSTRSNPLKHTHSNAPRSRKMLRPSTISRLRARTFCIAAAKARVKDWEPALQLPSRPHDTTQDMDNYVPWMTMYSAFDTGMVRLLLMSGWALNIPTTDICSPSPDAKAIVLPALSTKAITQALKIATVKPHKPWPYSLPRFLRPKTSTTYAMVYGKGDNDGAGTLCVRWIQAVLYEVPNLDERTERKTDGVCREVVYGVQEEVGEVTTVVEVIKVKPEEGKLGAGEDKTDEGNMAHMEGGGFSVGC